MSVHWYKYTDCFCDRMFWRDCVVLWRLICLDVCFRRCHQIISLKLFVADAVIFWRSLALRYPRIYEVLEIDGGFQDIIWMVNDEREIVNLGWYSLRYDMMMIDINIVVRVSLIDNNIGVRVSVIDTNIGVRFHVIDINKAVSVWWLIIIQVWECLWCDAARQCSGQWTEKLVPTCNSMKVWPCVKISQVP